MLGYLGGMAIAVVVYDLIGQALQDGSGPYFPHLDLGSWVVRVLLFTLIGWIAALVPFLAVQWSTGRRAFANPNAAVLSGVIVMFITLPIYLWLVRAVSIDAPPYSEQLAELLRRYWLAQIMSGAAFGLAYWAIERRLSLDRSKPARGDETRH